MLILVRSQIYEHKESRTSPALSQSWARGFAFAWIGPFLLLVVYRIGCTRTRRRILEAKAIFRRRFFGFSLVVLGFDAMGRSS